ncbi:endoplasmic reticulum lectin 1 isoform X2 [Orussus abietinus]|uniref:endoplasmic reticulum lectin 1 isoform X2 n=1 Tax=Orussus abietinus TaxID=222816 RepID=UPI000625439C|nr:endoplasmic reticulum lectin 1 isoform X2 [Orussus abietinus]
MWKLFIISDFYIYLLVCQTTVSIAGHDLKGFDDTVLFRINWPGESSADLLETQTNVAPYFITTANNERYQCFIPDTTKQEHDHGETYTWLNPIEILSPLFTQDSCSFKLESYWTYELCHGRYVRQYHEEREGKKVKIQEYYLGKLDPSEIVKLSAQYDQRAKNSNKADIPVKKVEGVNMPYVEIKMSDGTLCDLNGKPRMIRVLYTCYQHSKHEVFSLKEISSCEYEAVVLSPLLCHHPDYNPQDTGENEINCRPVNGAPRKPKALSAMDAESLKLRHPQVTDGETRVRVKIHPVDGIDNSNSIDKSLSPIGEQGTSPVDITPVQNFLSGKNCLYGGNGWWKYEFCYGRFVAQYHVERDGSKTVVNLGRFNLKKHLEWIEAHPKKRPKSLAQRKQLSHFYSGGSECDKTGKLRQTEVKLKCVEPQTTSPASVSLFLLEPKTCEYILGVESPLICDILEFADDNGLLSDQTSWSYIDWKAYLQEEEENDLDERIANGDE